MAPNPIYVLGTGLSHDGSCCLLRDGEVCVAIEKERVTRVKHDGFNDTAAVQYCLSAESITLTDVCLVVQAGAIRGGMFPYGNDWFEGPRLFGSETRVVTLSHHLAHAYGAFYTSPFDDADILVIDGAGSTFDDCMDLDGALIPEKPPAGLESLWHEKDSLYIARDGTVSACYKDFSPLGLALKRYPLHPPDTRHSIGGVYKAFSNYVFGGIDDSSKLMGLAPYGRRDTYKESIFELREGRVFVRYGWLKNFIMRPARSEACVKQNFQYYADLAAWMQSELERAVLYIVHSRYQLHPARNLCYTGGVALNAVVNSKIVGEGLYENVYITPAAGDNGIALGCAYYGWLDILKQRRVHHQGSTWFGRSYSAAEIEQALTQCDCTAEVSSIHDPEEQAAIYLSYGNVVGWFQSRSEFGPRALGNRSILADPRLPWVRDYINLQIKEREEFRPFAPSVLEEDAQVYFERIVDSPYMLLTVPVRAEWRNTLQAVTHVDGSARIQLVGPKLSPVYYRLLRCFKQHCGLGMLLNTSLNRRKMPIVETPAEAVEFFLSSGLHVLVLGSYIACKRARVRLGTQRDQGVAVA